MMVQWLDLTCYQFLYSLQTKIGFYIVLIVGEKKQKKIIFCDMWKLHEI